MYGREMRWDFPGRRRRVLALTDLHFCRKLNDRRINFILERLGKVCQVEKVDYIFCLGDLINSLDVLKDNEVRLRLEDFLSKLTKMAPMIMITGNHDISYYDLGPNRCVIRRSEWYAWVKQLMQNNSRIRVLDENLGDGAEIFDDGEMRVLGLSLPETCYVTKEKREKPSAVIFQHYVEQVLPELVQVPEREYYLLTHTPQFLSEIELDPKIVVLAGHMHNGMVPPILDGLTRFSHRGIVGPGYYTRSGRKTKFIPLASGSRYRPQPDRPWLTLDSSAHLPPESRLWILDGIYPALSYVIISDEGSQMKLSNKCFRRKSA